MFRRRRLFISNSTIIISVLPFLANLKPTAAPDTSATATVCPPEPANPLARLLGVNCEKSADCSFLGAEQRCCKGICRKGIEAPIYEPPHGGWS